MSEFGAASPTRQAFDALLDVWVAGWSVIRGLTEKVTPVDGGWHIRVNRPGHVARYILVADHPETIAEHAATVTTPGTWIKAPITDDELGSLLPEGWVPEEPGFLMTADLDDTVYRAPEGYRSSVERSPAGLAVTVTTTTGTHAAEGLAAALGAVAVFDQIVTEHDHRGRGLGTHVMRTLIRRLRADGATTGVLVATEAGRRLYERLGWQVVAPIAAARYSPRS